MRSSDPKAPLADWKKKRTGKCGTEGEKTWKIYPSDFLCEAHLQLLFFRTADVLPWQLVQLAAGAAGGATTTGTWTGYRARVDVQLLWLVGDWGQTNHLIKYEPLVNDSFGGRFSELTGVF